MTTDIDTRSDWLAWRAQGLGGSDIAAVMGLSPWASPWSVWADKVGLTPPDDTDTEAMEFGRRAETILAPWFADRTGLHVAGEQTWCTHQLEPWMRCTVDGFVFDGQGDDTDAALGVVEFKATSAPAGEWEQGIPVHYQCQATWNMLVTESQHCWFGVLHLAFGRPQFRVYELTLDAGDAELVLTAARTFWHDHVVAGEPPFVDGSQATTAALGRAFPTDDGDSVDIAGDEVHALQKLKAERKALDEQIAGHENMLKATLGEHTVGLIDGVKAVTWKAQDTARIDTSAFKAAWPDLAREFTRTTTSRVLRLHLRGD